MSRTHSTTIELNITVTYTAHAAYRGATDGPFGPPIEPDEPAYIEIDSVKLPDGTAIVLTREQYRCLETEIEDILDDGPDYDGRD